MAEVFHKQTVRWLDPEGRRCSPDTPGANRRVEESRKLYGSVNGKHVPLCRDKAASQRMLNKLLADVALASVGLTDPFAQHKHRPLADHLANFRTALEGSCPFCETGVRKIGWIG